MNKLYMKWLLLCVMVMCSSGAWADDKTITLDYNSFGLTTTSYATKTATVDGIGFTVNDGFKGSGNAIQMNSTKGSGILYNTTAISGLKSITVNVSSGSKTYTITTGTTEKPTANSQTGTATGTYNASSGDTYFQLKVSGASYFSSIVITYEESSNNNLTTSDFALTDAPIALNFDLYNNNASQTISYTTSSTGAVTVSGGTGYVTTSVNSENKTITVTPTAITPSTQTITVNQAADETYKAGSATFTLNITDSTPFVGGDITFTAGTDKGSTTANNSPDEVTKSVVTISSTDAALATDPYRFYMGSTTTFSTSQGAITSIVFTMASGYANTLLSTETGTYSNGTWTGNATSVAFSASAQVRVSKIVVTVDINAINSPTFSVESGTYTSAQSVTLSTPTDGATIYYTNDGTDPTEESTEYTGAISISETTTLKAISVKDGKSSGIASATYTIVSIEHAGTEADPYSVADARTAIDANIGLTDVYATGIVSEITTAYSSNVISYNITADGSTESDILQVYKGSSTDEDFIRVGDEVVVNGTLTKYKTTYEFSSGATVSSLKLAAPTFSVNEGTVLSGTEVTISTPHTGATIYYTTDGTTPTTSSTAYSEAISITSECTLKAIAVKEGATSSTVTSATYNIGGVITPSTTAVNATATETEGTINCEYSGFTLYDADVVFYESDGQTTATYDWVTASINASNNVEYLIEENTTTSARTAYLKVYALGANQEEVYSDLITITQAGIVVDYATLPFSYDGGKSNLPTGLTQSGLGSDYDSSPKLKFDGTGDYLILKLNEGDAALSYDIKGNGFSNGTFKVQTSVDGTDYTDLEQHTALNTTYTVTLYLNADVRYVKWIYTNKSSGNVALGNIKVEKITATLNASGFATFCYNLPLDFTNAEGYTAWQVTGTSDDAITFEKITGAIAAGQGILLMGNAGETITLTGCASGETLSSNMLVGTQSATAVTTVNGDYTNFGLSGDAFVKINDGTIPAGKAYLPVETSTLPANARMRLVFVDETTGIEAIEATTVENDIIYNLSGQRVAHPTKGIFIKNGKKFIVR